MAEPAGEVNNRLVRNMSFNTILITLSYCALPILFLQQLLSSKCSPLNTRLHILTTIILFLILANIIHSSVHSHLIRPVQANISLWKARWLRWRCPILTVIAIVALLSVVGWVIGGAREILGLLGMIWAATWC